jgi:acyl-homoserine lactone acylase PvdQ
VKGINDHVKSLSFLPIEFHLIGLEWEEWKVSDVFLISKLLIWSQSFNMADEYIRSSLLSNYTMEEIEKMIPFRY